MNDQLMLDEYGNLITAKELMLRKEAERMQQGQVQRMPEPKVNFQALAEPKQTQVRMPELPTEQPAAMPQQSMPSLRPSAPQTPAPTPSATQQPQEPQGLLARLFGDGDNRRRIGAELMMMSAAPQFQKMGAAKLAGIEEAAQERKATEVATAQRNKTIEYLANNGRKDLAEQVLAGLPPIEALKALRESPKANSTIGKLSADLKAGLITPEEYNIAVEGIRSGGSTNIDIGGIGLGDDWEKGANKYIIESYGDLADQGRKAMRSQVEIEQLEQALANSPQGTWGGVVGWAQNNLGLSLDANASDTQVAQAIISRLVPAQRQAGSGPMSDADLNLFKQSLPTLLGSPEGNRKVIDTIKAIAEYDRQIGDIARRVIIDPNYTPEMGDADMANLANPVMWVKGGEDRRSKFKVLD